MIGLMALAMETADAAKPPEVDLFLWKVTKSGAKPSYLFGVCHLNVPLERFLPEKQQKTLTKSTALYTEVGDEMMDVEGILDAIVAPTSLYDRVGEEVFSDVAYRARGGLPATVLDLMPAWVPGVMEFSYQLEWRLPPGDPNIPIIDDQLVAKATEAGVAHEPLETVEKQLAVYSQFDDVFAKALDGSSASAQRGVRIAEALAEACTTFDATKVEAILTEPDPTGFLHALLAARNQAWWTDLKPALEEGDVFVAAGPGHMFGPGGLVAMLTTDGFTVERMTGSPPPLPPAQGDGPAPVFDQPAADPTVVEMWMAAYRSTIPTLCDPAALLRSCFLPEEQVCSDAMNRAIHLCVNQYADTLPEPLPDSMPDPSWSPELMECIPTGVVLAGWARDSMQTTAPMCADVKASLDSSIGK
jgi:uncharacterized protein YbaP (TraB family)